MKYSTWKETGGRDLETETSSSLHSLSDLNKPINPLRLRSRCGVNVSGGEEEQLLVNRSEYSGVNSFKAERSMGRTDLTGSILGNDTRVCRMF